MDILAGPFVVALPLYKSGAFLKFLELSCTNILSSPSAAAIKMISSIFLNLVATLARVVKFSLCIGLAPHIVRCILIRLHPLNSLNDSKSNEILGCWPAVFPDQNRCDGNLMQGTPPRQSAIRISVPQQYFHFPHDPACVNVLSHENAQERVVAIVFVLTELLLKKTTQFSAKMAKYLK